MSAIFAFASCSDDEDEDDGSVKIHFTLLENKTFVIDEDTLIFTSDKTKIDDEEFTFFLYFESDSEDWMFGMMNDDPETMETIPLIGLYKGTSVQNSSATTTLLNRTHIMDSEFNWTSSPKSAWKSISIINKKYFYFTLTKEDIEELDKIFPDEE